MNRKNGEIDATRELGRSIACKVGTHLYLY